MSGKPHPKGVDEVRQRLRLMSGNFIEAQKLADEKRAIEKRLEVIASESAKAWNEVYAALAKMDVQSSGNFGHENRLAYFLRELVSPTEHPEIELPASPPYPVPPPPPIPSVPTGNGSGGGSGSASVIGSGGGSGSASVIGSGGGSGSASVIGSGGGYRG